MRIPSPPLRKSHQTTVSVACAALAIRPTLAKLAKSSFRITLHPPELLFGLAALNARFAHRGVFSKAAPMES
jgi:hypothetical protein